MDYSIIDKLYDIYVNEDLCEAKKQFTNYYKKYEQFGDYDFIETIKQYIKEQSKTISNFYISNKDEKKKVKNIVKDTTIAFETLVEPIHSYIIELIYKDYDSKELNGPIDIEELRPHDLLKMDINLMEEAIKKDAPFYLDTFKNVKVLIEYIKEHKLLEKLYSDASWRAINFGELIENLYDKAKDKSVFEMGYDGIYDYEETLFDKVKENCGKISTIEFDKYRTQLTSNKQIAVKFDKLIFCKNLLIFYETGIMPTNEGMIDCSIDFYEYLNLVDDFKKLYSKKFDEQAFREAQSNIICKPEIITSNYELKVSKKVSFDNSLIIGHLLTGNCSHMSSTNYEIPYLIHINIKDVNNPCSNYEIQLNLIPQGDLANRLQLMRFDNWKNKGKHRNISNKLNTTTHIHLYNQFDLIRGKENGEFEIVYNFENKSTEFNTAFFTFLEILDFDDELKLEIYSKTIGAIDKLKSVTKSIDT